MPERLQPNDDRRQIIEQALREEFAYFGILDEDGMSRDPGIDAEALQRIVSIIMSKEVNTVGGLTVFRPTKQRTL